MPLSPPSDETSSSLPPPLSLVVGVLRKVGQARKVTSAVKDGLRVARYGAGRAVDKLEREADRTAGSPSTPEPIGAGLKSIAFMARRANDTLNEAERGLLETLLPDHHPALHLDRPGLMAHLFPRNRDAAWTGRSSYFMRLVRSFADALIRLEGVEHYVLLDTGLAAAEQAVRHQRALADEDEPSAVEAARIALALVAAQPIQSLEAGPSPSAFPRFAEDGNAIVFLTFGLALAIGAAAGPGPFAPSGGDENGILAVARDLAAAEWPALGAASRAGDPLEAVARVYADLASMA